MNRMSAEAKGKVGLSEKEIVHVAHKFVGAQRRINPYAGRAQASPQVSYPYSRVGSQTIRFYPPGPSARGRSESNPYQWQYAL